MGRHCEAENAGTEYDWMQFFWSVNREGGAPISLGELADIYGLACGGSCNSRVVTWAQLDDAVRTYYGGMSSEVFSFLLSGAYTSVNH